MGYEEKYSGTSLKLNNNLLEDISGLPAALEGLIFNPMELTWIDLSCNKLTVIGEVNASLQHSPRFVSKGTNLSEYDRCHSAVSGVV